jgi:flagellar hook protein FlgE
MMRSLWSGVSGLKTHQMEMDVIGNNIANVNTTSYKSQATGFQDVLYQTVKQGTGAGENMGSTNIVQVGLGARVGSIYTNITSQGSAITTNNAYDLMITGESFFQISTDGGATKNYSRDGSFTIDAEGYLVTQANGYYVMGVMNGNVTDGAATERLQVIQTANGVISDSRAGTATSQAYFKGNIDSFDSSLEEGKNLMLEVFGTDGETYTIKFKLTDGGDKENNTFDLAVQSILDKDGNTIKFEETEPTHFVYDNHDGKLAENQVVTYNFNGDASVIGPLTIDFSNTSNYAGNSTTHASSIYAYKGDTQGLNKGYPNGDLTGISFGTDGSIYGTYSNGETIKKGQIAVAVFNNAMGLEKVGDNLYAESLNSGVAQIQDITKDGGYMQAGVLEGSNVDLAKEFTDMITTQRGFQANSRVITTSDEMLQVLRGLKR